MQGKRHALEPLIASFSTSMVVLLVNVLIAFVLRRTSAGATLNAYEQQIAQNVVDPSQIAERLDAIGGLTRVKRELRTEVLMPLRYPKVFFDAACDHLRPCKGVLLHGPPGVGKTMLAKAIAAEANVPFIALGLSALENKYYGESSKLLAATFSFARKRQPCVLFFDEIDGMLRRRNDMDQSSVYGFKTEFLSQMDGMSTVHTDSIMVIACTNCLHSLDPAIRRRLPKQLHISYPTAAEMVDIFELELGKKTSISREQLARLVRRVRPECSGSDVAATVRQAWSDLVRTRLDEPDVQALLRRPSTTAKDVSRAVGRLHLAHLVRAIKENGLWAQMRGR